MMPARSIITNTEKQQAGTVRPSCQKFVNEKMEFAVNMIMTTKEAGVFKEIREGVTSFECNHG